MERPRFGRPGGWGMLGTHGHRKRPFLVRGASRRLHFGPLRESSENLVGASVPLADMEAAVTHLRITQSNSHTHGCAAMFDIPTSGGPTQAPLAVDSRKRLDSSPGSICQLADAVTPAQGCVLAT